MIRRQLINFQNRSVDYRVGFGALEELSRMLSSAVGRPRKALLVATAPELERYGETVRRSLTDAGFAFEELVFDIADVADMAHASRLFDALDGAGITADDLIVALGGSPVCSLAGWAGEMWCGRTESLLIPTTLDAMVTVATTMDPISTDSGAPLVSLSPQPAVVCCDLDIVKAASAEELKPGYVKLVVSILASSLTRWNQFGESLGDLLVADELALINALQWSQSSRRDVLTATNPSARHALSFGEPCARALRRCLGDDIPAYRLLAEGMRFEARLAHEISDFDVDDVFELDDRLDDLGIDELAFDLDVDRFIESLRTEHFRRTNRFMFALPACPGAIRLSVVEDDVLERHAEAYLASRRELL